MASKRDKHIKHIKDDIMARVNEIMQKRKEKTERVKTAVKRRTENARAKKSTAPQNAITQNRLELLITVVNRSKGEYYLDLIQSFEVNMQCVLLGSGTADAKVLSRFGLTDSEKAVIFSVIQENKLPDALAALDEKFKTIKNGKGIAYTIPMTSVIGTLIFGFLSNNKMAVKDPKQ